MQGAVGLLARSSTACGRRMQSSMQRQLATEIFSGSQHHRMMPPRRHLRMVYARAQRCRVYSSASQIARIQTDIARGKSATDIVREYLKAAEAQEPSLRSFISLDSAGALEQVRKLSQLSKCNHGSQCSVHHHVKTCNQNSKL